MSEVVDDGPCPPDQFCGREEARGKIQEIISKAGEEGQIVLISGRAGIGKSSLLARIEHDLRPRDEAPRPAPEPAAEEDEGSVDACMGQLVLDPAYRTGAPERPPPARNVTTYLTIRREFFGTSGQIFSTFTQVVKVLQDDKVTRRFEGIFSDEGVKKALAVLAGALNVAVSITQPALVATTVKGVTDVALDGLEAAFPTQSSEYYRVLTSFQKVFEVISEKLKESEFQNRRVAILFDNVHLAKGADLELLKDLVRDVRKYPRIVFVLAFDRRTDDRQKEFVEIFCGQLKGAGIIELPEFTGTEIEEFARRRFNTKIETSAALYLLRCAGDPLTLVSFFKWLSEKNLEPTEEAIRAVRQYALRDPGRASFLGVDDPNVRERANRLCILSSPFPLEVAACLEGVGPLGLWRLKDDLETGPIFRRVEGEYYDFKAASTKEYCRAELPRSQKRELNRMAARCFESKLEDLEDRKKAELSLERHCFEAGEYEKALWRALRTFEYSYRNYNYSVALELVEHAITCASKLHRREALAGAYVKKGDILRLCYRYPGARDAYEKSLTIYRGMERCWRGVATAQARLGIVDQLTAELDEDSRGYTQALEKYRDSLALYRSNEDRHGEAYVLGLIGEVWLKLGRWDPALEHYRECLEIKQGLPERMPKLYGMACTLLDIGVVQARSGTSDAAQRSFGTSWMLCEEIGSEGRADSGVSAEEVADLMARIAKETGIVYRPARFRCALGHFEESLKRYQQLSDRTGEAEVLREMGTLYRCAGLSDEDIGVARKYYGESLAISRERGDRLGERKTRAELEVLGLSPETRGED